MRNYVDGKEYFIKGKARSGEVPGRPVEFAYESGYGTNCGILADEPGLLLTASEVAAELVEDTNAQIALYKDEIKKLRSENDGLKDAVEVLKEQKKGLEKTIDKHEATIEERTIECNRWEGMCDKASKRCDGLRAELESLKKDRDNLKENFDIALKNLADAGKTCDVFKKQRDEALKDKDDLQKALEALNKDIDEYRATIQKMASIIGFICGTKGGQNG